MDRNTQEVALLNEDPGQLIVAYQSLIQIVVQMFVKSGAFPNQDRDDVIQHINEKLLIRIYNIRGNYNGMSKLRTYMAAVIRNICIERSRELKSYRVEEPLAYYENSPSVESGQLERMAIRQELERLENVFIMYNQQRQKLEFCLKILYRFPVTEVDLQPFISNLPDEAALEAIQVFYQGVQLHAKQVYKHLTYFFNYLENKENEPDAMRKWLRLRVGSMISLMNGNPPRAWYTEETFQILVERYFAQKADHVNQKPIFIALERIQS